MSDTDDTDDLLLIPPDFFLIDSELEFGTSEVPYYSVFDSIITQVNLLERRLDHIQSASDLSSLDHSFNSGSRISQSMQNINDRHAHGGNESTQSTPQKPRSKFKLNSLPSSPNTPRNSPRRSRVNLFSPKTSDQTEVKKTSASDTRTAKELLGEIDNFISNVKTIQRINTARTLSEGGVVNTSKPVDKLEDQDFKKQSVWACGDNANTVPDYGMGMVNNMYKPQLSAERLCEQVELLPSGKGPTVSEASFLTNSESNADTISLSSSDSTQMTAVHKAPATGSQSNTNSIYLNAVKTMDRHKRLMSGDMSPTREDYGKGDSGRLPDINDLHLLSLRDLWGQKETSKHIERPTSSLAVKLEEEKLRRQHCEHMVKQLQSRILELQERLAVAFEVDQAKDEAIQRFHSAWENVAVKLQNLATEKSRIEESINRIKADNKRDLEEAAEKVAHYEKEASKALALAHNNHEKLAVLEKQYSDFQNQSQFLENQLQTVQNNYMAEVEKNRRLTEIIAQKEIELSENKNVLAQARKEVAQSKHAVEICQAEFTALKNECNQLKLQLNEEQQKVTDLENQKKKLISDISTHKKNEKNFQEEISKSKEQLEQQKLELKNFYQDQVEQVVKEKLAEFQAQLDRAEAALQEDLKQRELSIAKTAATHIQKIAEKHNLEVQLLEEKHKEEVRLYQIQLSQNEQQIQSLEARFQRQEDRRVQIAQQLHKVMEAQWVEALKIINNTKSPVLPSSRDVNAIDQLNSLRSKSHSNLEQVLSMNLKNEDEKNQSYMENSEVMGSTSSIIADDSRGYSANIENETPLIKRPPRSKKQMEAEIQKYLQLLLSRVPQDDGQKSKEVETHEDWQPSQPEHGPNEMKTSKGYSKERKFGKPPWK